MTTEQEIVNDWGRKSEEIGLRDGVTVMCPCGKPVSFGFVGDVGTVIHAVPYCEPFERLDPADFATHVRRAATLRAGGEVKA